MSITKYPPEPGENRHPHLRLVSSNEDAIAPATIPDEPEQARSTGHAVLHDLIRGLALAGDALHATPESVQAQSRLLEANSRSQSEGTGLLAWLKTRFRRTAAPVNHRHEPGGSVTSVSRSSREETEK
ncbi:hypothetical protein HGO38_28135 [Rhizobium sp. CG5]|uniref:hypothetical protein n=1 Tax=Rhizobium sp. CG5 TaxID=2726076 RepID=UPI002034110C|nr:hypothetical protein [Rhizobium sp. CG5]MCM2477324.1 hypothetical protein [Rhizobium sp. CG5]